MIINTEALRMRLLQSFSLALALSHACALHAAPLSQGAAWGCTFLLNTLLTSELVAVSEVKDASDVASTVASKDMVDLLQRARYAAAAAAKKQQSLQSQQSLKSILEIQAKKHPLKEVTAQTDITAAFAPAVQKHWQKLSSLYRLPAPPCPLTDAETRLFSRHQSVLLADAASANPQSLLKPIMSWPVAKIQCLVFATMAFADRSIKAQVKPSDPLHLLLALQQVRHLAARDIGVRTMLATRLFELRRYDETLRVLLDLQDDEPAFRLPYEIVQRIYSIKQKGQGEVALQGN
jgi:hypothetical protein